MKRVGKSVILILVVVALFSICAVGLVGCDFFGGGSSGSSTKTPSSVKVTLDLNGGTGVNQLTLVGKPGEPMTLQSPTRQGCTFDKWYEGYNLIDNTVFPNKDTVLTARYYCNEDYVASTSWTSTLNKTYGGSSGYVGYDRVGLDDGVMDYILNNTNVNVTVEVKLEAVCSAIGISQTFGTEASITLTGANRRDAFSKVTVKNYKQYQSYTLKANTTSDKLIGGSNGILINLVYDTTLGSTECIFRNVTTTFICTVVAGSLL
ncbi:MAG: InlB B-repeat-containing protein [Clostridia bacterium]|nr:InlB B-repeat-containing protein [Clostridia bacterium]